jgi:hypothetical protein
MIKIHNYNKINKGVITIIFLNIISITNDDNRFINISRIMIKLLTVLHFDKKKL